MQKLKDYKYQQKNKRKETCGRVLLKLKNYEEQPKKGKKPDKETVIDEGS